MDYLPSPWNAYCSTLLARHVPIRHFAGELPVLHFARDVADEFVHCHHVVGGVVATGEGAWVGFEQYQASLG